MVEVTVPIGQLVFHIQEYSRDPAGEGRELVTVDVCIEKPRLRPRRHAATAAGGAP